MDLDNTVTDGQADGQAEGLAGTGAAALAAQAPASLSEEKKKEEDEDKEEEFKSKEKEGKEEKLEEETGEQRESRQLLLPPPSSSLPPYSQEPLLAGLKPLPRIRPVSVATAPPIRDQSDLLLQVDPYAPPHEDFISLHPSSPIKSPPPDYEGKTQRQKAPS